MASAAGAPRVCSMRTIKSDVVVGLGPDGDLTALVEANVRMQVENLAQSDVLQRAWAAGKDVQVHGWVYELETGRLRDLGVSVGKGGAL